MTDDWYITQSFVFPSHCSPSINLSEELILCVKREQDGYNQLLHEYEHVVELLKQRDEEMSERLIVLKDFHQALMKTNQMHSVEDLLNSYMWNNLSQTTDNLENRCYKMPDGKTREYIYDLMSVKRTPNSI